MAIAPGGGMLDPAGLERLRHAARDNSPEAIKAAATQFEALFLDMVMKSMREAAPSEGLFDSEQGRMMQGMLDQQYAQALAARGIGLADVLARQMMPKGTPAGMPAGTSFTERLAPHAEAASAATGLPAKFMLAQAALESGWGKREILNADGSPSHNVFGIKAGRGWHGKVAEVMTTEFVDGVAQKRVEKFRAYDSYAEAFGDYARMLSSSPRYREVMATTDGHGFAEALQKAGYATDPLYAQKLKGVLAKV
ncbi:MAG: flagellar assembly peptidoglycan hydrolase FlgJ [Burkholderiaceae bacterium]|nr:flagellar assembly peptidoglycan hydrolase FlgJ [Burkholderiaceae bacterium]